jgi:hypothetical protein
MTWTDRLKCLLGFHWWTRWHLTYDDTDHEWYEWKSCSNCGKRETRS